MLKEFTEYFLNIKTKSIDYKNFSKFIKSLDKLDLSPIKYELSLKCMTNEHYMLDIIKKDNNIQDIIKFIYYTIICYLINKKDLKLIASKEMNTKENTIYIIYKTDTQEKLNIFLLFLRIFYLVDLSPSNYIGIDLEFNTKVAALIQLCFEGFKLPDEDINYSFIFIFDPKQFNKEDLRCLVKNYLTNDKYFKILHGAESLDVPFLFSSIFNNNNDDIIKFTRMYIDTRYLCEYYNKEQLKNKNKCKIYYALLNTGVITKKHFDKLKKNDSKMGPIYEIIININNMTTELLKYTLYDVLFLKNFFFKFAYRDNRKQKIYINVIPELTQLILLEKKNIINILSKYKEQIDKTNNNYTFIKKKFYKLIDIFKILKEEINLNKINLKYLLAINYYRGFIFYIIKLITYNYIIKNYTVYMAKNKSNSNLLNFKDIEDQLIKLGYTNISILINNLIISIKQKFQLIFIN